jgi:hypothetical protein
MTFPVTFHTTFRENWPAELSHRSVPAISFALLPHELDYLGQWQQVYSSYYPNSFVKNCPSLDAKIDTAFHKSPKVFPRLSFCSWQSAKLRGKPCTNVGDILAIICQKDDRIDSYMTAARAQYTPIWLHLIEWRDLAGFDEVRLFFRNRYLVGASSYHEDANHPISESRALEMVRKIKNFSVQICCHLPLENIIVDCLIPKECSALPELLELNPFGPISSAGHFSWDEGFTNQYRSLLQRIDF